MATTCVAFQQDIKSGQAVALLQLQFVAGRPCSWTAHAAQLRQVTSEVDGDHISQNGTLNPNQMCTTLVEVVVVVVVEWT